MAPAGNCTKGPYRPARRPLVALAGRIWDFRFLADRRTSQPRCYGRMLTCPSLCTGATFRPMAMRQRRGPSASHVEQTDFLSMCFIKGANGLRRRLNNNLAILLSEESICLRRELHVPALA